MPRKPLTSADNPIEIATVAMSPDAGLIGITFAPGKDQPDGLTGAHRRDLAADLDAVAAWNAAAVVTLIEPHEMESLGIGSLGAEVRRRHMEWHHWPIRDYGVPDAVFEAAWPARSTRLRSLLASGGRVLIHCKGGLGRAGMIAARLMVEGGIAPHDAIHAVRIARPKAIETVAQGAWVAAGQPRPLARPDPGRGAARDRAVGALLGLAVGDAVGAAIEFSPKPVYAVLDDMAHGGPHRLARGQWTDDTAMALALADSLAEAPNLDPADLMRRFLDWRDSGTYSCTGVCFDIGNATSAALDRFRRNGNPLAGSPDAAASGNGALMRLAPVAIRHWRDRDALQQTAALQTRTTHGSPATLAASGTFATLLADAIAGASLPEVLASQAAQQIEGGWRGLHRDDVKGSGWVVQSLQAAAWAVSRTTDFRSAVLLAANLGDDADTTAAIAGQLAGSIYGASGIPPDWLAALAWRERLDQAAARLFDAGWPPTDDAAWSMTRDWTRRERLQALAGVSVIGQDFHQMLYDYGWVRRFDWTAWRSTEAGHRLMHDPVAMDDATEDDLARVLTTCCRADRFSEGYLDDAAASGLIGRIARRAGQLLARLDE